MILMIIFLIILVVLCLYLGYKVYDLNEENKDLELEYDKIKNEAEEWYREASEKLRNLESEVECKKNEINKLNEDLKDTNKSLEFSINERRKLELEIESLNKKIKEFTKEIENLQSGTLDHEILEETENINEETTEEPKEEFVPDLAYYKKVNQKLLDEDNEYIEKCIKELREYEDRIGKKTGRIVFKNGKISIRNLLNEIAKLS